MARDYAARNRRPAPKAAGLPGWVWLIAGLSMGLVVACIVYIGRPAQPMPMAAANGTTEAAAPDKPRAKVEIPPKEDPRFDFYTLLEKEQVLVPGETRLRPPVPAATAARPTTPGTAPATALTSPTPATTPAAPGSSGQYLILAGSFRDATNADAHKAKLAMAGVEARIETITTQDHATLYRVRVGPSKSLEQAQGVAAKLKSQGFDSRVVKLP
ncbi:cell division protein FtsN [Panacagrimonas perspica]|uniref:Cell division protein FtsN n=1 Tax=Panacagrimonas perspica TaxID=381431 RepID=A0A4S3K048_9GAMM|nr:SPOR domain-containing protein [Panacagrimonas perspica]TDU28417.1 cell division protein FtsN [Panacagrimonas perspica]THD01074.1 hypothetical protein B1810_21615 [Panacagrimonas perspica]